VTVVYLALDNWNTPLPELIVMALLFNRLTNALGSIQKGLFNLATREASFKTIVDAINQAEIEKEYDFGVSITEDFSSIRFENVSFSYTSNQVLENVSFSILANSLTVLVGPSGAGKSTLADMIIGFYKPNKGMIYVDDMPINEIDIECWRSQIGYVPQDILLSNDTVFKNITLYDDAYSEEDVKKALVDAGAWDFVSKLSEGMYASVGEYGSKLSGGQVQRLSIARALIRKPKLLLLDEATANLDVDNELEICQLISKLSKNITVLAITHRKPLVDIADVVYYVENGCVDKNNRYVNKGA
jgi:ATP-binding cassette subfamily C protein